MHVNNKKNRDATRHDESMKKSTVSIVTCGGETSKGAISAPNEKEDETKKKKEASSNENNKDVARHNGSMKKPAVLVVTCGGDNSTGAISATNEKEGETKKKKVSLSKEKNKVAARHNESINKAAVLIVTRGGDNPTKREDETNKRKAILKEENNNASRQNDSGKCNVVPQGLAKNKTIQQNINVAKKRAPCELIINGKKRSIETERVSIVKQKFCGKSDANQVECKKVDKSEVKNYCPCQQYQLREGHHRLLNTGCVMFLRLLGQEDSYRYNQGYCLENAVCAGEKCNKVLGSDLLISRSSAVYACMNAFTTDYCNFVVCGTCYNEYSARGGRTRGNRKRTKGKAYYRK